MIKNMKDKPQTPQNNMEEKTVTEWMRETLTNEDWVKFSDNLERDDFKSVFFDDKFSHPASALNLAVNWCNAKEGGEYWCGISNKMALSEYNKTTKSEESTRPIVSHYLGTVEPIDLINSHNLNFNLGNVVKYATRCGKKDSAEKDLKKIIDYANFELKRIKQ